MLEEIVDIPTPDGVMGVIVKHPDGESSVMVGFSELFLRRAYAINDTFSLGQIAGGEGAGDQSAPQGEQPGK